MEIYGRVLKDHFKDEQKGILWLHNIYGQPEDMPVDIFFRDETEIPELERIALDLCKGKTLDIGAGVGSHALLLQARGIDVTALEISGSACEIMKERGIKKIINQDVFQYDAGKFDTLLLLMNGIGLCEDIRGLQVFLEYIKKLLLPGGQVIFDSSDISYLFEKIDYPLRNYYGEISYQYEYQGIKGRWFKWIYIDYVKLKVMAEQHGWSCEMIYEDDMDQYLACMKLAE